MVLDVIENEPLDPGSSLWLDPNVIITPHVSGTFQLVKAKEISLDIARQNVHAFIHDKPLINQISNIKQHPVMLFLLYVKEKSGKFH